MQLQKNSLAEMSKGVNRPAVSKRKRERKEGEEERRRGGEEGRVIGEKRCFFYLFFDWCSSISYEFAPGGERARLRRCSEGTIRQAERQDVQARQHTQRQ